MATLDELIGSWTLSLRAANRAPRTVAQYLDESLAQRRGHVEVRVHHSQWAGDARSDELVERHGPHARCERSPGTGAGAGWSCASALWPNTAGVKSVRSGVGNPLWMIGLQPVVRVTVPSGCDA